MSPGMSCRRHVELALLLLVGCGDDAASPPVDVRRDLVFVVGDSDEVVQPDLDDVDILTTIDGEFQVIEGDQVDDVLRFEGVETSPFYLRVGPTYYVLDDREVHQVVHVLGRSDVRRPTRRDTTITLDVDGLSPWNAEDWLRLYSPEAGASELLTADYVEGFPEVDDTALSGFQVNYGDFRDPWGNVTAPLIEADRGDRTFLFQLEHSVEDFGTLRAARQVFASEAVDMEDGADTQAAGTFAAGEELETVLRFQRPDHEDLADLIGQNATVDGEPFCRLMAVPRSNSYGLYTQAGGLLQASIVSPDVDVAVAFSNPFPTSWLRMQCGIFFAVPISIATSSQPLYYSIGGLLTEFPAESAGDFDGRPSLTPVTDVTIDGTLLSELTQMNRNPTIAWARPSVGAPTEFWVELTGVNADDGAVTSQIYFVTKSAELDIPDPLLVPGEYYEVRITALAKGSDFWGVSTVVNPPVQVFED